MYKDLLTFNVQEKLNKFQMLSPKLYRKFWLNKILQHFRKMKLFKIYPYQNSKDGQ